MVQWEISDSEVDYDTALEKMDNHVGKMIAAKLVKRSGYWNILLFILPEPARIKRILSNQIDFLFLKQNVVGSTLIMGPANELFT